MLMKRHLHFPLLCMLLMLSGTLMAQTTVTIDFDNDYQTLFPTLPGVSSNDSHDGDFTAATTSTPVGGVMVLIAPDEEAKTPSRIWSSAPRLRMYSGMFTVIGNGITKIEFTGHNTNFNLTPLSGTLDGKIWTGDDDMVMFMVNKNTQINKIVVTMGGEVGPGPGPDDDEGLEYTSGTINETDNQIVFDFTATDRQRQYDVTGQMVFDFVDNACTRVTTSITYPTEALAQEGYQEALAESEEYESVQIDGRTVTAVITKQFAGFSKTLVKRMLALLLGDEQSLFTGAGTLASPFTATDAYIMASFGLEPGEVSSEDYYIKGIISSIKYTYNSQYGTATFFISDDGTTSGEQFQCYSVLFLENKSWVDGFTQIEEGDDVIICGKLTNYQGIPETASKQAYLYSLNGVTKAGDTPQPQVQKVSVSQALEIIDALENGKTTAETYQVKGYVISVTEISTQYGNATFIIADSKSDETGLTVFRAKGFNGENITDEQLLEVGDEVIVEGKLQKYVKNDVVTPEVATGGIIVSINGQESSIAAIEADNKPTVVYNMQGQRVANMQKGLYIVNGRKVIVR